MYFLHRELNSQQKTSIYGKETRHRLWCFEHSPSPFDSIREAVLTVSPNRQYLGIFRPTTPAHTGPRKHTFPSQSLYRVQPQSRSKAAFVHGRINGRVAWTHFTQLSGPFELCSEDRKFFILAVNTHELNMKNLLGLIFIKQLLLIFVLEC